MRPAADAAKVRSGGVYSAVARKSAPSRSLPAVTTSSLVNLFMWWNAPAKRRKRKLFSRDVQVSAPVREYFCSEERSRAEQEAFADLLLKLDADPVSHTSAILDPPIPGMRWAKLGRRKVIVHFDPSHDRVKVVLIE